MGMRPTTRIWGMESHWEYVSAVGQSMIAVLTPITTAILLTPLCPALVHEEACSLDPAHKEGLFDTPELETSLLCYCNIEGIKIHY